MRSYAYMVLSSVCMGFIGVTIKLLGDSMHLMTINFFRMFFGFIFLLLVVPLFDRKCFSVTRKDLRDFFLIGALYAVSLSLFNGANLFAPVQNVILIDSFYPFFILIFAYFILKEKITSTKIITLIMALAGLAIINPFEHGSHELGNLMALAGALTYSLLIVEMRKEELTHGVGDILWILLFATIVLSPFPLIYGFGSVVEVLPMLLVLGFVSTGFAYFLFNLALKELEAETSSMITIIITPLVSILLAVILINEALNMRVILGGALLIGSGIYLQLHRKELKESGLHIPSFLRRRKPMLPARDLE